MLIYLSMNEEAHCATFVATHMDAFAKYSYNFSGKTMSSFFSKWDFCSWCCGQLGSRNCVISSEDIRLQAAERRLWCVVNIQDFLDICAMQPIAKLLHSKSALSIIKSVD